MLKSSEHLCLQKAIWLKRVTLYLLSETDKRIDGYSFTVYGLKLEQISIKIGDNCFGRC